MARPLAKPKDIERGIEDEWQRKAMANAIAAARLVDIGQPVRVKSLSELEWGWIISAAIFGWIKTKAEQATFEGINADITIRSIHGDPTAWEAGAVDSILSALSELEIDWTKPVGDWPKDQIRKFLWTSYKLVDAALAARDEGASRDGLITKRPDIAARNAMAAAGGSLMDPDELNDEIPF